MAICKTCRKNKRKSELTKLPNINGFLCDSCLEKGEEELDFDNGQDIDESVMKKAIKVTKQQREDK